MTGTVCFNHFSKSQLSRGTITSDIRAALKKSAVPSLNLGFVDTINSSHLPLPSERFNPPATPATSSKSHSIHSSSASPIQIEAPVFCECCKPILSEKEEEIKRIKAEYIKQKHEFLVYSEKSENRIKELQRKVKKIQDHAYFLQKLKDRICQGLEKNEKISKLLEVFMIIDV